MTTTNSNSKIILKLVSVEYTYFTNAINCLGRSFSSSCGQTLVLVFHAVFIMSLIYHLFYLLFLCFFGCIIVSVTSSNGASQSHHVSSREKVFVAMKPDAIQRNLVGDIIQRFERKGLRLVAIKLVQPDKSTVKEQYHDLVKAPFFHDIMSFFCSGPVCASVWEGENAVHLARKLIGKTHPEDAEPGSIRGKSYKQYLCNIYIYVDVLYIF